MRGGRARKPPPSPLSGWLAHVVRREGLGCRRRCANVSAEERRGGVRRGRAPPPPAERLVPSAAAGRGRGGGSRLRGALPPPAGGRGARSLSQPRLGPRRGRVRAGAGREARRGRGAQPGARVSWPAGRRPALLCRWLAGTPKQKGFRGVSGGGSFLPPELPSRELPSAQRSSSPAAGSGEARRCLWKGRFRNRKNT